MKNLTRTVAFIITFVFAVESGAIPAQGHKIMVAGPSPYSPEIVQKISSQGGNVVDAAVAVALGLAVTGPYFAALGGGGFALVKMQEQPVAALDFRETAPKVATRTMYSDKDSLTGGLAVGVPGVPAGLVALHKKYGKLAWAKLVQPAIELSRKGFRVSGEWAEKTNANKDRFSAGAKTVLFKKSGDAFKAGELLKQPGLTKALELLAKQGEKGFYTGPVAKDIVSAVTATGGIISLADLASYKVRWLEPLTAEFAGRKLYLMPPPSSGGIVIKSALQLTDKLKLKEMAPLSSDEFHAIAEILKMSFRGRSLLGDPDFAKLPIEKLTSPQYLFEMADKFKSSKTMKLEPVKESEETTHFSILDSEGNAVALTVTLNGDYGSGVVSQKYGIALNNEMDDFTTKPGQPNLFGLVQGKANEIEPGKRPLSSMSPTLVEKDEKIELTLGSPGGPRIISAVYQVLYRVLVSGWNIDEAIQAPRVHHQFQPNFTYIDARRVSPEVIANLKNRGHEIKEQPVAKVYGVMRTQSGALEAAHDARGEGGSGGF